MNSGSEIIMDPTRRIHSGRERIEAELRQLRRHLADAWWYEQPLETIQEIERLIAARSRELSDSA